MRLISKKIIKLADLGLDGTDCKDSNFLYTNPSLFEVIYGVHYNEDHTEKLPVVSSSKMIKVDADRKIIIFGFDDADLVWENLEVHKLRKAFIKQFGKLEILYQCGYIQGLHSPTLGGSTGMMSANNYPGYQFWQKVHIL